MRMVEVKVHAQRELFCEEVHLKFQIVCHRDEMQGFGVVEKLVYVVLLPWNLHQVLPSRGAIQLPLDGVFPLIHVSFSPPSVASSNLRTPVSASEHGVSP